MANTELVGVWDADIIIPLENIDYAVKQNISGRETITYPFYRKCICLGEKESYTFCNSMDIKTISDSTSPFLLGRPTCGGAFIVNKKRYMSIGGENKRFTGWGPEDAERMRRCRILGHQANWIDIGLAYHLVHPINANSRYFSQEMADSMRREFINICGMSTEELTIYMTKK